MRQKSVKAVSITFVLVTLAAASGCHSGSSGRNDAVNAGSPLPQQPASQQSSAPGAGASASAATQPGASSATQPAASSSAAPATAGSGTSSSSGSGSGTSTQASKAPGKPSGFTRAGTYTYDLSGTASQPFGGSQNVSGTQSFVVDPPKGSSQHSKTSGQNGSQDTTLTVRSSGLFVDDIHISQQGFDEDFKPVGTATYFPASYRTGSHWSWQAKSTDGKYTLDVSSTISGSGSQTISGKSYKALVLDTTLHITGNGFDITSQQRDWVSTTYALILKEHAVTNGTAYGAKLSSDVTRTLRSTNPS